MRVGTTTASSPGLQHPVHLLSQGAADKDVIFKVLLNENETTPLPSSIAPYYHWSDFKAFISINSTLARNETSAAIPAFDAAARQLQRLRLSPYDVNISGGRASTPETSRSSRGRLQDKDTFARGFHG